MKRAAVELKNVSFSYAGAETPVLRQIDFTLHFGEIALLTGPSGQGKSTLLSLIAGVIPNLIDGELQGEISVDGEPTRGKALREICRTVGVVLQNADAQIIQRTVEDEIAFGCENFNFSRDSIAQSIRAACDKTALRPEWQTRTLSGGQKQRVITASTLATQQKILLVDEPLANLDSAGAVLLMQTLRGLADDGYAVLIIEHRLDIVIRAADAVWALQAGTLRRIENTAAFLQSDTEIIADGCMPPQKNSPVFSLRDVSFQVKRRTILHSLSFDIYRGERVLLLGENGCGKTTLLRLLARLYDPSSGEIQQSVIAKLKPRRTSREWFRRIGVVYQNPNYQLFMPTVRDELLFHAFSPEYAAQIMQAFGLESLAQRHPQSLSEGQKRRVTIAAVLAQKPEVLLLDEPTVGQDYAGLKAMIETMNHIHAQTGSTMVTVTHDRRCAGALCDKAIVMKAGTVQAIGNKQLVKNYFGGNCYENR